MIRTRKPPPSSSAPSSIWTLTRAKSRFSEVVRRAQSRPQIVTRNGEAAAVIVSAEEWDRKTARGGTLAEFLLASPLRQAGIDLERRQDRPRDVTL
jgi:prevent-host-death family protein